MTTHEKDDGMSEQEKCPLCGEAGKLIGCEVYVSLWSRGARMRICEKCIEVLEMRHMYVRVEDEEGLNVGA